MTTHVNPPIPPTWRLLEQHEVTSAIGAWAVATLTAYRTSGAPPMFGYVTRSDFGDSKTYEALVCWHPPDEQNHVEHSGVTVYQNMVPGIAVPNPLTFPGPTPLKAVTATLGAVGVDTDTKLSGLSAPALRQAGMAFVVRYVSLGSPDASGDLTPGEAQAIVGAGLALMIVQHVRAPGWMPSAALGAQYGAAAASDAAAVGYPAGCTLWCDLEGVAAAASAADVTAYVNAWCGAVTSKGFVAGLYVGGGSVLNGDELYATAASRYWRSFSAVPNVANRGYCMMQLYPTTTVAGISVDLNVVQGDYKGSRPTWATA